MCWNIFTYLYISLRSKSSWWYPVDFQFWISNWETSLIFLGFHTWSTPIARWCIQIDWCLKNHCMSMIHNIDSYRLYDIYRYIITPICEPWYWTIYQHLTHTFAQFCRLYMEHLGHDKPYLEMFGDITSFYLNVK